MENVALIVQEIYFLILKKQYGSSTRSDLELLRFDIIQFLKISKEKFKHYLEIHNVETFDEFYSRIIVNFNSLITDTIKEVGEIPLDIEVIDSKSGAKTTLNNIMKYGLYSLYKEYLYHLPHPYIVSQIAEKYERIKQILSNIDEYTLSELIIEFDSIIDTIHVTGKFVQTYMGFDPERCKELAERKFKYYSR